MDQVDLLLRRFDPRLRFLLEGVDHPNVVADLQRVDHPERVAAMLERQFHHAGAKTSQRLGNYRMTAVGNRRQGVKQIVARTLREVLKVLPCRFDPLNWARVFYHWP